MSKWKGLGSGEHWSVGTFLYAHVTDFKFAVNTLLNFIQTLIKICQQKFEFVWQTPKTSWVLRILFIAVFYAKIRFKVNTCYDLWYNVMVVDIALSP